MPNQTLGFAEVLVGGILLTTGITGAGLKQTLKGQAGNSIKWPWNSGTATVGTATVNNGSGPAPGPALTPGGIRTPPGNNEASPGGGSVLLDPGVNMGVGREPEIMRRLGILSSELKQKVYVISGYRSPAHSVAVGGYANDPHTRGEAADIGIGSPTLASMNPITDAELRKVGLYRPFPGESEINHVQLLP